jgi:hypothetical protein
VDIVQRINLQNSSLLKMPVNELTKLDDVPYEEKSNNPLDHSAIERDPAKTRNIMFDADRICLIEQGPFQPKLTRYPRNPNIKDKKKTMYVFIRMVQTVSIPRIFPPHRQSFLLCVSVIPSI